MRGPENSERGPAPLQEVLSSARDNNNNNMTKVQARRSSGTGAEAFLSPIEREAPPVPTEQSQLDHQVGDRRQTQTRTARKEVVEVRTPSSKRSVSKTLASLQVDLQDSEVLDTDATTVGTGATTTAAATTTTTTTNATANATASPQRMNQTSRQIDANFPAAAPTARKLESSLSGAEEQQQQQRRQQALAQLNVVSPDRAGPSDMVESLQLQVRFVCLSQAGRQCGGSRGAAWGLGSCFGRWSGLYCNTVVCPAGVVLIPIKHLLSRLHLYDRVRV